jgi:hypothetical protein
MAITREQVADLRPGDVVELRDERWPGVVTRGPVREGERGYLWLADVVVKDKDPSRQFAPHTATLTVVSRVPRPLYVNHDRTEVAKGDVVRDADEDDRFTWFNDGSSDNAWCSLQDMAVWGRGDMPTRLHLLVDGETGQVVP